MRQKPYPRSRPASQVTALPCGSASSRSRNSPSVQALLRPGTGLSVRGPNPSSGCARRTSWVASIATEIPWARKYRAARARWRSPVTSRTERDARSGSARSIRAHRATDPAVSGPPGSTEMASAGTPACSATARMVSASVIRSGATPLPENSRRAAGCFFQSATAARARARVDSPAHASASATVSVSPGGRAAIAAVSSPAPREMITKDCTRRAYHSPRLGRSLVAQGFHRAQIGRLLRRIDAEEQARSDGHADRQQDRGD